MCPRCGYTLNGAADVDGIDSPRAGDLSFCLGCAEILQFDRNLKLGAIEPAELNQLLLKQPGLAEDLAHKRRAVLKFIRLSQ